MDRRPPRPWLPSAIAALEDAKQGDMAERGRRLTAFRLATEGKVWRYIDPIGEWWLCDLLSGEVLTPHPDTTSHG